jgi:hypothetical protein
MKRLIHQRRLNSRRQFEARLVYLSEKSRTKRVVRSVLLVVTLLCASGLMLAPIIF